GQPRQQYVAKAVQCDTEKLAARTTNTSAAVGKNARLKNWLRTWEYWIHTGNQDIYVTEQKDPFDANYQSFDIELSTAQPYSIQSSVAFLFREDSPSNELQPQFRELVPYPDESDNAKQGRKFKVLRPNAGEKLLVFSKVSSSTGDT